VVCDADVAPGVAAQDGKPAEVDGQVADPAAVVEGAEQGAAGEPGTATGQGRNQPPAQSEEGAAPQVDGVEKQGSPSEAPEQQGQTDGDTELTEAGR
jgi:hypothetical protein